MTVETRPPHISMLSDWRTQVFRVGTEYKLPIALLAIHSEGLARLVTLADAQEEDNASEAEIVSLRDDSVSVGVISLSDDENEFEAFCDAILDPLGFFDKQPDLAQSLGTLKMARKYSATLIERRAHDITLKMTAPSTIKSHLTDKLDSLKVVEISHQIDCEESLLSAWKVAMDEFKDKKRKFAEMINAAESTSRKDLIGEAYYATMLKNLPVWNLKKEGLSDRQIHSILIGMAKLTAKSDEFFHQEYRRTWSNGSSPAGWNDGSPHRAFTFGIAKKRAFLSMPSFDFLGILHLASTLEPTEFTSGGSPAAPVFSASVLAPGEALSREKKLVWKYFEDDEEPKVPIASPVAPEAISSEAPTTESAAFAAPEPPPATDSSSANTKEEKPVLKKKKGGWEGRGERRG